MSPVVLYIDDHREYQSRLAWRLRSLADDTYEVITVHVNNEAETHDAIKSLGREILHRITISICPNYLFFEAIFNHLVELIVHINLYEGRNDQPSHASSSSSLKSRTELHQDTPFAHHEENNVRETRIKTLTVSRFARASEIDAMIRRHIAVDIPTRGTKGSLSNSIGTHLSFSHEKGMRVTRYVIDRAQTLGHAVIYLPLKPLYKMEGRFRIGHGLTIGELIYRFYSGDIPEIDALGQWLYMHEKGYYTFSLPERSDDLITCDITILRQITNAWREYTHTRSHPTTSWIDIEGMPLGDVLALAVLCDFIYVDAPVGSTDKEAIARRELGLFMAKLPKDCRILELPSRHQISETKHHMAHHQELGIASEL